MQEEPQTLRKVRPAAHILVLLVLGSHVQNYCQAAMDNHLVHRSVGWGGKVLGAGSYKGRNPLTGLDMTDCVEEDIDAADLGRSRHYSWSPEGVRDMKGFVGRSRVYQNLMSRIARLGGRSKRDFAVHQVGDCMAGVAEHNRLVWIDSHGYQTARG